MLAIEVETLDSSAVPSFVFLCHPPDQLFIRMNNWSVTEGILASCKQEAHSRDKQVSRAWERDPP